MEDLTYLANEADFLRWISEHVHSRPRRFIEEEDDFFDDRMNDWRKRVNDDSPESYPCIAVLGVRSFGYEEFKPIYIYLDDAEKLVHLSN